MSAGRWVRWAVAAMLFIQPFTGPLGAQVPSPAGAVLLQIRPRAGDTLRVRLDQTVEMAGTVRGRDSVTSLATESSTLVVLSRLHVESTDQDGVTIVAETDSVRLTSPPSSASGAMLAWAQGAQGRRVRFRVATDGSTSPAGDADWRAPPPGAIVTQMPATLPRKPITVGATWTSAMDVPVTGALGPRAMATLTATFRFDSLSRSGELAYVSIRGRLSRAAQEVKEGVASVVETTGTVSGYLLVDRRRGWITDARTTVSVRSLVAPSVRGKPPMRVQMTITQWMRVM